MHGQHILITGITGFIGQHLATFLKSHYPTCKITGVGRSHPKFPNNYDFHCIDLLNEHDVFEIINQIKPDYIFHLAGLVFSYDLNALYKINVIGTVNLLEAIKKVKMNTHTVIAGSAAEYGAVSSNHLPITESFLPNPQTPYGLTKLWQNNIGLYYSTCNVSVTSARIFNIIAANSAQQLSTGHLFVQLQRIIQNHVKPRIFVGDLQIKRDFLDIEDVCAGLIAIAKNGQRGNIYNLCSGFSKSLQEILDVALQVSDLDLDLDIVTDNTKTQNTYATDIYGCNKKIIKDTSWRPKIKLEDSIKNALFGITHRFTRSYTKETC